MYANGSYRFILRLTSKSLPRDVQAVSWSNQNLQSTKCFILLNPPSSTYFHLDLRNANIITITATVVESVYICKDFRTVHTWHHYTTITLVLTSWFHSSVVWDLHSPTHIYFHLGKTIAITLAMVRALYFSPCHQIPLSSFLNSASSRSGTVPRCYLSFRSTKLTV